MKYMLLFYSNEAAGLPEADQAGIYADWMNVLKEATAAGVLRFNSGLAPVSNATTVRVREKDEETYIYIKQAGGQIVGLTVLALDSDQEAALINIVGTLDPAEIGRLGRGLNIPQLQKVPAGKKADNGGKP